MYCSNCGKEYEEGTKFCGNCGMSFDAQAVSEEAIADEPLHYQAQEAMTFSKSITTCLSKYADFKGRASRSEYWWFYLFSLLMSWGALLVDDTKVLSLLINLGFMLPVFAAGSRRLHDTNRSGWWQLLMITIIGIIPLLIWYSTKGESGNNRFGDKV